MRVRVGNRSTSRAPRPVTLPVTLMVTGALLLGACGGDATEVTPPPGGAAGDASTPAAPAGARTPLPTRASVLHDGPVVSPADGERWTNPGWTVEHDGTYWMFRNSFSAFPGASRVDLLRSTDLVTWEVVGDGPVLTNDDVPFADGKTAFVMTGFITDDGTWTAIVSTFLGELNAGPLGRATAPGPEGPWTVDPEPILASGEPGTFDARRTREPSVVRGHDGRYRLYYTGYDDVDGTGRIGVATSTDGVAWERYRGPEHGGAVIDGLQAWNQGEAGGAQVVLTDDGYLMVYDSADLAVFGAGLATSNDGFVWTPLRTNPVLTSDQAPASGKFYQSEVLWQGDELRWLLEVAGDGGTAIHLLGLDVTTALRVEETAPDLRATWRLEGDVVVIEAEAEGVELTFVEGDDSGATAHLHAYVNRPPPRDGDAIRTNSPSIVHATGATLRVEDLGPGTHTIWVVLGDGTDRVLLPPQPVRLVVEIP